MSQNNLGTVVGDLEKAIVPNRGPNLLPSKRCCFRTKKGPVATIGVFVGFLLVSAGFAASVYHKRVDSPCGQDWISNFLCSSEEAVVKEISFLGHRGDPKRPHGNDLTNRKPHGNNFTNGSNHSISKKYAHGSDLPAIPTRIWTGREDFVMLEKCLRKHTFLPNSITNFHARFVHNYTSENCSELITTSISLDIGRVGYCHQHSRNGEELSSYPQCFMEAYERCSSQIVGSFHCICKAIDISNGYVRDWDSQFSICIPWRTICCIQ